MNVEQFVYHYTASWEWKQVAKLKWHTNEVMDFAEAFAKQANLVENRVMPKIACEWKWNATFEKHGFVSGCGYYLAELYRDHSYKYCPHCGKEIRTV